MSNFVESGYTRALKAAGFEVIDYQEFGDWQGTWFAFVKLNGTFGFIRDSYGSCSGCDAFNDEVPNENEESLKAFGKKYLDDLQTFDQVLQYAKRNESWDLEAKPMIEWVEKHRYEVDFDKLVNEKEKKDSCV